MFEVKLRFLRLGGPGPKVKVKVNVHTLDIAPLRSESPPQKRSGMASILKEKKHNQLLIFTRFYALCRQSVVLHP